MECRLFSTDGTRIAPVNQTHTHTYTVIHAWRDGKLESPIGKYTRNEKKKKIGRKIILRSITQSCSRLKPTTPRRTQLCNWT